jgi:hypothetical protein
MSATQELQARLMPMEEAERQIASISDVIVKAPLRNVKIVPDLSLLLPDGRNIPVSKDAGDIVERKLRFPMSFARRLQSIKTQDIVPLLDRESVNMRADVEGQFLLRRGRLIDIVDTSKPVLTIADAFRVAKDTLPDIAGVESISVNDVARIRLVTGLAKTPPKKVNDPSYAGLALTVGPTPGIDAYIFRLACTNGMIHEHHHIIKLADATVNIEQAYRDAVVRQFDYARDHFLPAFMESTEIVVPNPDRIVHSLAQEFRLSPDLEDMLLDRVSLLPTETTYYDVINMITDFANKQKKHHKLFERLQRFGGQVTHASHVSRCASCARPFARN